MESRYLMALIQPQSHKKKRAGNVVGIETSAHEKNVSKITLIGKE